MARIRKTRPKCFLRYTQHILHWHSYTSYTNFMSQNLAENYFDVLARAVCGNRNTPTMHNDYHWLYHIKYVCYIIHVQPCLAVCFTSLCPRWPSGNNYIRYMLSTTCSRLEAAIMQCTNYKATCALMCVRYNCILQLFKNEGVSNKLHVEVIFGYL